MFMNMICFKIKCIMICTLECIELELFINEKIIFNILLKTNWNYLI